MAERPLPSREPHIDENQTSSVGREELEPKRDVILAVEITDFVPPEAWSKKAD
jgi:hypothetical protein